MFKVALFCGDFILSSSLFEILKGEDFSPRSFRDIDSFKAGLVDNPSNQLVAICDKSFLDKAALLKSIFNKLDLVFVSNSPSVKESVTVLKSGFSDYIHPPFPPLEVREKISALLTKRPKTEVSERKIVLPKFDRNGIVGLSKSIEGVVELIKKVAPYHTAVLIRGETGCGKELVAKAIHNNSPRFEKPFIAVNCSALPENLLESELFGHVKGSFTSAVNDRVGLIEAAEGGTIFLDEVGFLQFSLQAKLLRFLQEKEVRKVGDTESKKVDVRVISATNQPLEEMVAAKKFREDLYYRLNVLPIVVSPLRERLADIPLIVANFLHKRPAGAKTITNTALKILLQWHWPGNVRELQNVLEMAIARCDSNVLDVLDLNPTFVNKVIVRQNNTSSPLGSGEADKMIENCNSQLKSPEKKAFDSSVKSYRCENSTGGKVISLNDFLLQQEREYVYATLVNNGWQRNKTAKMLKIAYKRVLNVINDRKKSEGHSVVPITREGSLRGKAMMAKRAKDMADRKAKEG